MVRGSGDVSLRAATSELLTMTNMSTKQSRQQEEGWSIGRRQHAPDQAERREGTD